MLPDGVCFIPREMEQKWAIFLHGGQLIAVRSWTRTVHLVADLAVSGDTATVRSISGTFGNDAANEPAANTINWFDFMIRTHVLKESYPLWLPVESLEDDKAAALFAFALFGNLAWFATPESIPRQIPQSPLRTHSLLHIAVARGDLDEAGMQLEAGVPIDLLANDGLTPLHWALARDNLDALSFLLDQGGPIDARSAEGATPLMNAVQGKSIEAVRLLLERGADANAQDTRGFTALHRAAEMGQLEMVKLLIENGADRQCVAEGHSPLSLARTRGQKAIETFLSE
jgi:hypothetical protein